MHIAAVFCAFLPCYAHAGSFFSASSDWVHVLTPAFSLQLPAWMQTPCSYGAVQ